MGSTIDCFFINPTTQIEVWLRRFVFSKAEDNHSHEATVSIGPGTRIRDFSGYQVEDLSHEDPRWPIACQACGYLFQKSDAWQTMHYTLFERSDTRGLTTLKQAPVGAMWYAPWYRDLYTGPDGECLVVKTPGGEWVVDSPALNSGRPWTRTGVPPKVTASPSIVMGREYHGWLKNGQLIAC